ncbi:2OG-Fe(II) oxygenase [Bradyrhizobium sp. WSM 4400]|nr:2OG-Fe(II) oxygenase [Bradyrhizobium australafricanum]
MFGAETQLPLKKGDAAVSAVNARPVRGVRGDYQVKLNHGVSKLYQGRRHTVGVIFHTRPECLK